MEEADFNVPLGYEEDTSMSKEILNHLFSKKDLNLKTDLSEREIKLLTRLHMIGVIFNITSLTKLTKEFKELRVSKQRLGRQELVNSIQYTEERTKEDNAEVMRRAFGVR